MKTTDVQLSVVVPVYNEAAVLASFHVALSQVLQDVKLTYEIVYVEDGSTDGTRRQLQQLAKTDSAVRFLCLTRNFGKEIALTAGLRASRGEAVLTMDGDGQHPVGSIPAFVEAWREGARVVVGKRTNRHASLTKRVGSRLFYGAFQRATGMRIDSNSSDFRLIDRVVCDEFNALTEHNRMTRALIDWFGYPKATIPYSELSRQSGESPYTFRKLMKLAVDSAISHSTSPLYIAAYAGAAIIALAVVVGVGMGVNYVLGDPLGLRATASAYGLDLILFLIGLLLVSQGIIGLYLSHIHAETQGRPLYVIDEKESRL